MDRPTHDEQNRMSQQEKQGVGYLWLTVLGIFACLVIFLVIYLVVV